jgi:hypothetical protein
MTDDRTLERAARSWLEAGPTEAPGHTVEAALRLIWTTPQERDLRVPWRVRTMSTPMRLAMAAIAIAVVTIGGVLLLRPADDASVGITPPSLVPSVAPSPVPPSTPPSVAPPSTGPSATPSPTPKVTAPPSTTVDASEFAVPFTMTWDLKLNTEIVNPDSVELHAESNTGFNLFLIGRVGADPCTSNVLTARPVTTAQAFMDWLGTIPNLTALPVTPVTIGGHPGLTRELDIGTLSSCFDPSYLHSGIVTTHDTMPGGFLMASGEREQWTAVEVGGKLIAFTVWPLDTAVFAPAADKAVSTIRFAH